ncbi:AMP-binding protein [Sulfidibacter corallicola]|uniref:AMP-binding protein n=2 Tax=Sulfidibacter corallicola TaxID=2818388 RepID=A0A8A4TZA3_SULCO|nr:AMP-binding protein [Sulfidibacter corallicola]
MGERQPHTLGVVFPEGRDAAGRVAYTHLTYRQLNRESDRLALALTEYGIGRGMRTVLMVKPCLEFFALTFTLFKMGAVPVFVDPGMGLKSLKTCLEEAEPEAFIGIPKAHIARLLLRWPRFQKLVTVGSKKGWGGATLADLRARIGPDDVFSMARTAADDLAAILFTSGSTGPPKGAVYTHGTFDAQVRLLKNTYDIQPGEVDLATFPLFALFAPALGMTAIVPDMDATRPAEVDPTKIIEAIENFGVTNMFGSPALLNTVGRFGAAKGIQCGSLKRIISAGAPVSAEILRRFSQMLPDHAQIFTPYGATESLPVCNIGSKEILGGTAEATAQGKGVCVGRPVEEMEVRIMRISDEPVAEWHPDLEVASGEIGEVVVRGPVVTRKYFNRDQATKLHKMVDGDDIIRHRMGDLGYFDGKGRLWFCGRKAHRVHTESGTLYTVPVEGVFNAHPDVFRTALVGKAGEGNVQTPVLCVELEKGSVSRNRDKIVAELLELGSRHEHTRTIRDIRFISAFPVDIRHNAKIFREKLALQVAG